MAVDQTARRSAPDNAPVFRAAPHNIEAEQALLGAILVNNEAFYRVSDFLKPEHFFEPIHAKSFDLAASLTAAPEVVITPLTLTANHSVDGVSFTLPIVTALTDLTCNIAMTVTDGGPPRYAMLTHDFGTEPILIIGAGDVNAATP